LEKIFSFKARTCQGPFLIIRVNFYESIVNEKRGQGSHTCELETKLAIFCSGKHCLGFQLPIKKFPHRIQISFSHIHVSVAALLTHAVSVLICKA